MTGLGEVRLIAQGRDSEEKRPGIEYTCGGGEEAVFCSALFLCNHIKIHNLPKRERLLFFLIYG